MWRLKPGDKLEIIKSFNVSGSNIIYKKGMILELIEPTSEAPYGHQSLITNWVIRCPYHDKSVWSSIYWALDMGLLIMIENAIDKLENILKGQNND